jgi:hypothetical protein
VSVGKKVSGTVVLAWPAAVLERRFQPELLHDALHPCGAPKGLTTRRRLSQALQFRGWLRAIHPPSPVLGTRHRPGGQQLLRRLAAVGPPSEARPRPRFRTLTQACPQRIPLHIAADGQEVVVLLDQERFEPPLVDMPRADGMPMGVPPLGMGQRQPAHEPG